jgi:hypothetical protein
MEQALEGLAPGIQIGSAVLQLGVLFWFARYYIQNISKGEWVPRRELDYIREDRDARLSQATAQCADWRAAHETSERTRELQAAQVAQLVEALRAQERFFDAFRAIIERADREGPFDGAA